MRVLLLGLLAFFITGRSEYDLHHPISKFTLPAELTEVSGLTDVDDNTVACLQDEAATIYLLDLRNGKVLEKHPFGPPGDMEGLTRVADGYYALRSDGLVYHLKGLRGKLQLTDSFHLKLPSQNIEGLGYDEARKLVLISPKDVQKGSPQVRDQRHVYAFDPATKKMMDKPVLSFSVRNIVIAAEKAGIETPVKETKNGVERSALKLRMSSIAVHPRTQHYYILSAVDQSLLVLDREGRFVDLHLLDDSLLPKPEGITFLPNGDLLLTTEGKGGPPRLVRFAQN
jgi:uncharacterized protein YjiK